MTKTDQVSEVLDRKAEQAFHLASILKGRGNDQGAKVERAKGAAYRDAAFHARSLGMGS